MKNERTPSQEELQEKMKDWLELKKVLVNPGWQQLKVFYSFMDKYGGKALQAAIDNFMLESKGRVWSERGFISKDANNKIKKPYEEGAQGTVNIWEVAKANEWWND